MLMCTHMISQSWLFFLNVSHWNGLVYPDHLTTFGVNVRLSFCVFVLQYYFTVTFNHDNQKALELRTEDVKDCDEWVAAITQAR